MSNLTIANEIKNQLGGKALYMLGAKNLVGDDNSLTFKIMKNSYGVTHIKVELSPLDLYVVTFYKIRGTKCTVVSVEENVYCDQLASTIETNTGLYTKL